ncbi:uncharacterized protein LOC133354545 [Lethenteron reissneri]|uniref:uncharacterized protein LOC133354545 n=1 Tax=Lethenteron reissneri TaxID=7753 RepID=UPI002AB73F6E|nr:uncharacterized protein LOC133354545 [Lethenteron reissneri]
MGTTKEVRAVNPESDPNNLYYGKQYIIYNPSQDPVQNGSCLIFRRNTEYDLHSKENVRFWLNLNGNAENKKFPDLVAGLRKSFPDVKFTRRLVKLMAALLRTYEEDGYLSLSSFCRLVGWFGPLNRCSINGRQTCILLKNLEALFEKSMLSSCLGVPESWFAGHMTQTEAWTLLKGAVPGTFLIRFSESQAENGSFALSIATASGEPENVSIHGDPCTASLGNPMLNLALRYGGDDDNCRYPDLPTLVATRLKKHPFHSDHVERCILPCPRLPLAYIFNMPAGNET